MSKTLQKKTCSRVFQPVFDISQSLVANVAFVESERNPCLFSVICDELKSTVVLKHAFIICLQTGLGGCKIGFFIPALCLKFLSRPVVPRLSEFSCQVFYGRMLQYFPTYHVGYQYSIFCFPTWLFHLESHSVKCLILHPTKSILDARLMPLNQEL